jgi:hypothetical protein
VPVRREAGGGEESVRLEIERSGSPAVGSCLLRILYAIPTGVARRVVPPFRLGA